MKVTAEFVNDEETANYSSQRNNHSDLDNNFKIANPLVSGPSTVGQFSNASPMRVNDDLSIRSFQKANQQKKKSPIVPRLDMQRVFEIQRL